MKKLKFIKLLVGILSLSSLASCQSGTKIDYFSPQYVYLGAYLDVCMYENGIKEEELQNHIISCERWTEIEKIYKDNGWGEILKETERGIVCDNCFTFWDNYKSQGKKEGEYCWACEGEGRWHYCEITHIIMADKSDNRFYVQYVSGKWTETDKN